MYRFALFALLASTLAGCAKLKLHEEDLVDSRILFTPDEPAGGISQWAYELGPAGEVLGCNIEQVYQADNWVFDEGEQSVQIFFGGAWEKYYMTAHTDDLSTGDFGYESSVGIDMAGSWVRNSGLECTYCPCD